jgi:acyl-CoA dehydrogenase
MDFTLSEELTMIRDMARDFVQNELLPIEREVLVRDAQVGGRRGAPIPPEKRARLKRLAVDQGLWAMTAPEALGGGGLSTLGACLVAEELGKTLVDFDFGDIPPILFDANGEQREKYLKPAIAGEKEIALALREPDSDEIQTRATREGDSWILNGAKLAEPADVYLVFARADEGVTCFIVEGLAVQDGKLALENARVPASNVLGEIGGAFVLGKKSQNARWVRAAARKVGIAARLLEISSQYARDWKALGQPLAVRPAVQRNLADMAIEMDAARWLVYHAACEIDEGKDARASAPRAYLFAAEMAQRALDRTIEIYGGPAHASDLPILRIYGADRKANERILELQRFKVTSSLTNPEGL